MLSNLHELNKLEIHFGREKVPDMAQVNVNVTLVTKVISVMNVQTVSLRRTETTLTLHAQLATPPVSQHAGRRGLKDVTNAKRAGK